MIATIVALLTVFSGLLWKGWSLAGQVKQNTSWITLQEYSQLTKWINAEEKECGENAKNCNERRQDILRLWKLRIKELNKQLGY